MDLSNQPSVHVLSLPALLLITAWAVSACSGSSDSVVDGSATDTNDVSVDLTPSTPPVVTPDTIPENNVGGVEETEGVLEDDANISTEESIAIANEDNTVTTPNDPVVEDPLIPNTIPVSFEITVPAYQSSELRVELVWGDLNFTALWIGDESWEASAEFPTNTQNQLSVTFFDFNGGLEIARFTQNFATGSNLTEALQISADQFNASQFDMDGDGVSNLDELIAGTDPQLDEDSLLRIDDSIALSNSLSVSLHFESRLSQVRPLSIDTSESDATGRNTTDVNANIDAQGNGTLTVAIQNGINSMSLSGIRTHTENSITWEGNRRSFVDADVRTTVDFTNTITVLNANTRQFIEEVTSVSSATYTTTSSISTNLTGQLIEGSSSLCSAVAGTVITQIESNNNNPRSNQTITISKELNDPYWRVVSDVDEYFVRELRILRSSNLSFTFNEPEDAYFLCDFVDIEVP